MSLLLIYGIFTTSIDAIQSNWDIYLGNNHLGAANSDERVFSRFTTTEDVYVSHNLDVMDCLQIVNPGKPSLRLPSSNLVRSCVTKDPLYPVAAGTWYLRIVANSKQSHTLQTYNKHGSAHVSIIILKDKETRKSLMYKLLRRRHEREE